MIGLGEISTKSEVGGVKQPVNAISKPECVRGLRQRNVAGSACNFPVEMLRPPLVRDVPADFSTESIKLELQPYTLLAQVREVCCARLQIKTAAQSQSADRQTIGFPVSCAAQLRESLPQPGRCNHEFGSVEPACFGLAHGQTSASQQNQGRAVLYAHLRLGDAQIFRQQPLQRGPPVPAKRPQVWICAVQLYMQFPNRKIVNNAAVHVQKDMLEIQTHTDIRGG